MGTAESKFKVGDRVRVLHTDYPDSLPVGCYTTVARIDRDGDVHLNYPDGDAYGLFFFKNEFEPAPLFAVGDKVRVVKSGHEGGGSLHCAAIGDVFEVSGVNESGVWTSSWYFYFHELEPAATAAKLKVGDKVRPIHGGLDYAAGQTYPVTRVFDDGVWIRDDIGDSNFIPLDHIEPVAVAASNDNAPTITITASKFYKTRDGRKVGPLEEYADVEHPWVSDFENTTGDPHRLLFKASGENYELRHLDLVAEWPTDSGCAAAQVDNLRDEYGPYVKTEPKFKVGDMVKVVRHCNFHGDEIKLGVPVGEVRRIVEQTDQLSGSGVDAFLLEGDNVYIYTRLNLELVPSSPAIVCRIENGQPLPSNRPFVHASEADATKEAARLAAENEGNEFGVYVLTATKREERTYDHEWQRLAAGGQKIAAIKELRGLTGIGLRPAKDAVEDWLGMRAA